MKSYYLRTSDDTELSFNAVRAELTEPLPSIPTDSWMAQRGYLRIYDHKPELLANEVYSGYAQEVGPERVDRFWTVAAAKGAAEYLADVKAAAKARIAELRWQKEVGGLDVGGAIVKTDRESQASLASAYSTIKNSLRPSIRWKAEGGVWVTMTLTEVEPIAAAVANFVAGLFEQEEQFQIGIDACTTVAEVEAYLAAVAF